MKKIGIVLILIMIICGCTNRLDENQLIYNSYVEELKELKSTNTAKDIVDIDIKLEKSSNDEITYRVTIDNPKEKMKQVEAFVYHDQQTEDIYSSIGVFDEKVNLIPNLKEKDEKNTEGIVLVGYIKTKKEIEDFHPTMKVMILYNNQENERQKIYFTKKM